MPRLKISLVGTSQMAFVSFYNDEFKQAFKMLTQLNLIKWLSCLIMKFPEMDRRACLYGNIDVTISELGKDDIHTKIFSYENNFGDEVGGVEKYLEPNMGQY